MVLEEEYAKFDIEMQFNAPYYDALGYINKLEMLSAYLNISDIVIERMREAKFFGDTTVTMVLSTLLSKDKSAPQAKVFDLGQTLTVKDFFKRNPFLANSDTVGAREQAKYLLSGITFAGANSTAMPV